jgi:hydrogenase small subunit
MDKPPGATVSSGMVGIYGRAVTALRKITNNTVNKEPKWRHPGRQLTTGYSPRAY